MQGWDGNGRQFCVRMHNSAGDIGDKGCEQQFAFLCQYDCDDVYTGLTHTQQKKTASKYTDVVGSMCTPRSTVLFFQVVQM